jgi:WD40 repeat protein
MLDAPSGIHNSPTRPNKRHSQEETDDMDYLSDNGADAASSAKPSSPIERPFKSRLSIQDADGEERINWTHLYKQRQKLEHNWTKGRFVTFQLPHPSYPQEAHTECVYTIQFFGRWLVSGSRDKTLRVWDLETRRLRGKPLTGHSQSVLCLQFDPTEQEDVIISGSSDASVIIWRFSTGQKIHEIPSAHEESVLNLRFDRRYLVTCSKDRRIKIWNRNHLVATDKDYPELKQASLAKVPSYIVNTSEMEPSLLEARMANGQIRALKPYMLLLTLEGHNAAVNAIQINGDLIVSASGDRHIKIWNAKNGRLLRTLQGHHKGIACVQFDGKRIVSGSSDNTVRIYDPFTSVEVAELKGHTNLVRTVQAGFGDMPDTDEEGEARAAERAWLEDLASGALIENKDHRRTPRNAGEGPSRFSPLNSKLPPGGGGSKWGRIVSGSYDESIIIWRKNARGDWIIGQMLRQESSTPPPHNPMPIIPRPRVFHPIVAPPAVMIPPPAPVGPQLHPAQPVVLPSNPGPAGHVRPAVLSASQVVQQAMNSSLANFGSGLSNVSSLSRALNGTGDSSRSSSHSNVNMTITGSNAQAIAQQAAAQAQAAITQAMNAALRAQQAQSLQQPSNGAVGPSPAAAAAQQQLSAPSPAPLPPSVIPTAPTSVPPAVHPLAAPIVPGTLLNPAQLPLSVTTNPVAAATVATATQPSSVSRVFKLQFDARRIVCCSQDSRIVGWDFANDDPEIIEACRFFIGP